MNFYVSGSMVKYSGASSHNDGDFPKANRRGAVALTLPNTRFINKRENP